MSPLNYFFINVPNILLLSFVARSKHEIRSLSHEEEYRWTQVYVGHCATRQIQVQSQLYAHGMGIRQIAHMCVEHDVMRDVLL